ncbi:hypothetical protein PPYR_00341, partial [Photinus pyralis]
LAVRLRSQLVNVLSENLISLKSFIPVEINRKPRSLSELMRWKATEFRTFLLYLGPLVLLNVVDQAVYEHFLLLHVAVVLVMSEHHIAMFGSQLSSQLFNLFVTHSEHIYGNEFYVYNVHYLTHLHDDVEIFGVLDNFSAFPFENYLAQIKRLVKSPDNPLPQISRRLLEMSHSCDPCLGNLRNDETNHKFEHNSGPTAQLLCKQFKQITMDGFSFSIYSYSCADSYCLTKDKMVIRIENILLSSSRNTLIVCKEFKSYESFYNYPFNSNVIGIVKIKDLSLELKVITLKDITAKCIVLPTNTKDNSWISMPLIHTL